MLRRPAPQPAAPSGPPPATGTPPPGHRGGGRQRAESLQPGTSPGESWREAQLAETLAAATERKGTGAPRSLRCCLVRSVLGAASEGPCAPVHLTVSGRLQGQPGRVNQGRGPSRPLGGSPLWSPGSRPPAASCGIRCSLHKAKVFQCGPPWEHLSPDECRWQRLI